MNKARTIVETSSTTHSDITSILHISKHFRVTPISHYAPLLNSCHGQFVNCCNFFQNREIQTVKYSPPTLDLILTKNSKPIPIHPSPKYTLPPTQWASTHLHIPVPEDSPLDIKVSWEMCSHIWTSGPTSSWMFYCCAART